MSLVGQGRNRRVRTLFSKERSALAIPNLIEVQKHSYDRFLQLETPPERRENMGLQAAFTSVFPIVDFNGSAKIEFVGYTVGPAQHDARECMDNGITYAASLKMQVRLELFEKGQAEGRTVRELRAQEIYVGEIPLMTENGTFLINGVERVVVSQIQRSPGVTFSHDKGKSHASGKILYSGCIIPYRGSWVDFEFDVKDVLHVRIDRKKKMPATIFLKAFIKKESATNGVRYSLQGREGKVVGATVQEVILKTFYPIETVRLSDGKYYLKLNADIHAGMRAFSDIVEKRSKAVLTKAGSKITASVIRKMIADDVLEIAYPTEALVGKVVLHDVVAQTTGEVIVEGGGALGEEHLHRMVEAGVPSIQLLHIDNIRSLPVILDTLALEKAASPDEAMVEIYRRVRPGEVPTLEIAKNLFESLFVHAKRYDLSHVGRMKLNKKLGLTLPLSVRELTAVDIVEVVRYIINLRAGSGAIDDIDHLANRRIRSVGELLENQFRLGLLRMEKTTKERMNLLDLDSALPHDLVNTKPVAGAVKEFFAGSQLSQFMDQTNPLAEITHRRRLSALGPGGLTRDRAGFEVRDVHPSHYGRICPIETPEGPNIGLIASLATYVRVNEFGFIESPHRKVENGVCSDRVEYISSVDSDRYVTALADTEIDQNGRLKGTVAARLGGNFVTVSPEKVDYMDVSQKQIVSVATALIPFLENDDANRALMGSNMQRQSVPLLCPEAPVVGTGMESVVARDSGHVIFAKRSGVVESVDATRIVVKAESSKRGSAAQTAYDDPEFSLDVYPVRKFKRSNQNTCINQRVVVSPGQRVKKGEVLADGPATQGGELALGCNVTVAFMPWRGYNFEDAIIVSERLIKEDVFTSIHMDEFQIEARDTKLGKEEITRDIPTISDEMLRNLDESGIIRIGAEVKPGDVLVGKVTPKGETQLTPEEKLLRAIFGENAGDVKDASLYAPPGLEGVVVDVKILSRKGGEQDERSKSIENEDILELQKNYQDEIRIIQEEKYNKIRQLLLSKVSGSDVVDAEVGEIFLKKKKIITKEVLLRIEDDDLKNVVLSDRGGQERIHQLDAAAKEQIEAIQSAYDEKIGRLKRRDELPPGVIKVVVVFIATKRKLQVGDKMAGRHGNKGVVSKILAIEDMPSLPDGRPVDIILNPLGVPSRMNVGQILETHLGWAADTLGMNVASPVFDGVTESEIKGLLERAHLPTSGQIVLYDGVTGEPFDRPVTVGVMYMLKLNHLVDDKMHARSVGPYSLVTQQPLGGKAQFGGQRLGEMEVWALQAYSAAALLQEFLTVKSDDVHGRSRIYESIIKGDHILEPGLPESFNVLVKELQSLGLDVELLHNTVPQEQFTALSFES